MDYEYDLDLIVENTDKPLDMVLYILEQYLLEDGIKGIDRYQDSLGDAWKSLRDAYHIKASR